MAQSIRTDQGGIAIVDSILAMLLFAIASAMVLSFLRSTTLALQTRRVTDDLNEHARIAIEVMARDLRDAGYGLTHSADRGLRVASQTTVGIARDRDLDGKTTSSGERVAYVIDPDSKRLLRRFGRAAPQPMVDNIDPSHSGFRFFDGSGTQIGGVGPLQDDQRALVHQVEISLHMEAGHPVAGHPPITAARTTSVSLRNAQL